jgi:hypothetical protein
MSRFKSQVLNATTLTTKPIILRNILQRRLQAIRMIFIVARLTEEQVGMIFVAAADATSFVRIRCDCCRGCFWLLGGCSSSFDELLELG